MNITQAQSLIRQTLNDNGYGHVPFEWDRGRRRIAATHFLGGTVIKVTFSHHYASTLSESEIKETVLHEIAHIKAGHKAGHGPLWQAHARALGIQAKRCATVAAEAKPATAWEGRCAAGHKTSGQHRAPLRVRSCGKCSPKFSMNYLVEWYKNGSKVPVSAMPQRYRTEYSQLVLKHNNNYLSVNFK